MAEKYVGNAPEAVRQARLKTMREKIHFVRESDGFEVHIPRFRLKKEHVNKLFGDEVEHVHDLEGNVILPDDYMWHCLPHPLKYFVYHRERVELPPDDAHDPWYIGETQIVVTRAPAGIAAQALVAWIRKGVERGDLRYMEAKAAVDKLRESLKRNKDRQDNVPFMKTSAESEQGMAAERLLLTKELKKEREELDEKMKTAQARLDRENARRRLHEVTVECVRVDEKRKVSDWHATFGTRREENAAVTMDQWPSVRVFRDPDKAGKQFIAHWDDELDAKDEILQDPDLEINMRGVQICRIKHGAGAFTDWQRGDAYKGAFVEGLRHGRGILYDRVGIYRGEFENDMRHGKGVQVFANGDEFEGPFDHDRIHGPDGVMRFADGSVYEGDFAFGVPTGQGAYRNARTKETMAGDFVDGLLHGVGLHTQQTGERCEGDFVQGRLHGRGSWRSRKGDVCEGDFEHGEPHGHARYTFRRGPQYEGFYYDGMRAGPGSMIYGNVQTFFDRATGKDFLKHDFKYEGTWLAGRIQARNTHVTVHDRLLPLEKEIPQPGYLFEQHDMLGFTTNAKSWARYPFLHALVHKEEQKREKRFLRKRAIARKERKTLRQTWKRNTTAFKRKRRDIISLFKRIDRALQSIRSEAQDNQAKLEPSDGLIPDGANEDDDDDDDNHDHDDDDGLSAGSHDMGDNSGASRFMHQTKAPDAGDDSDDASEDASDDASDGASGDDSYDEQDNVENDEDGGGSEWDYYDDSDWFSDEEYFNGHEGAAPAQSSTVFLPKAVTANPVYQELRISLVDVFEDPPPTDSKAGIVSLRSALEYYAQREHKRKIEELLRKRQSA